MTAIVTELELLREAARAMRARAQAATPGPWWLGRTSTLYMSGQGVYHIRTAGQPGIKATVTSHPADAEHIASWHPAVALAVADWLDAEATHHESVVALATAATAGDEWVVRLSASTLPQAVAVARAYLGERAS